MGNAATDYAAAQVGKGYVFATPPICDAREHATYDCSGLAGCAWRAAGHAPIPRTTFLMYPMLCGGGRGVPVAQAGIGDLLFWHYEAGNPMPSHVAVNLGGGYLVEAADESQGVIRRRWSTSEPALMPKAASLGAAATTTTGPDSLSGDGTGTDNAAGTSKKTGGSAALATGLAAFGMEALFIAGGATLVVLGGLKVAGGGSITGGAMKIGKVAAL